MLAFIGFSFTPTDLQVESLFRLATVSNTVLERVLIVNPNREHRQRIRAILAPALTYQAPVLTQFDTFQVAAPRLAEVLG